MRDFFSTGIPCLTTFFTPEILAEKKKKKGKKKKKKKKKKTLFSSFLFKALFFDFMGSQRYE